MRYLLLAAALLALPASASAQNHRGAERRSDDRQSDQRHGNDHRQSDSQKTAQPPADNRTPAWEQKQTPWWEHQQPPSWERPTPSPAQQLLPEWARVNRPPTPPDTRALGGQAGTHHRRSYQPSAIYVLPDYRYMPNTLPGTTQFYVTPPPPTAAIAAPTSVMGALRLEVEPRELLQIYVDGNFAGTMSDHDGEIELTPGTRRIELRAPGYRTLIFNVDIPADKMITYRGELEREAIAPPQPTITIPQPQAAPGSKTIYVIPGCYLGNVPPKSSDLRAGCDISKMTTVSP